MKVLKVSEIIRLLEQNGWYLHLHNGTSHRQFKHHIIKGKVTVNGNPSADISGTLLKSIEKQSGIIF
jgi:predicted RNA binding protein YcfA (HicA-like mRNA interferase family)